MTQNTVPVLFIMEHGLRGVLMATLTHMNNAY
jgi:hypothetical protein